MMRRFFHPLLAGATLADRLRACGGALLGIAVVSLVGARLLPLAAVPSPWLVAPIGASAVLVFAVPASPLAQPWAVFGGNVVSALVGTLAVRLCPEPQLAAALAVGGAILAMSLLRCLHPPGGAAALTAVIGGSAVVAEGFRFAIAPVGVDTALLVAAGWVYHLWSGHSYPHRPQRAGPAAAPPLVLHPADVDQALADLGEAFDVDRADLDVLLARAEHHAARRRRGAAAR